MAMTNTGIYGLGKLFPELFFFQVLKQTVSSPMFVSDRQEFQYLIVITDPSNEKLNRPVTTREQLMLISAFFGFSKSKLGEIFGVTRQSVYNWFDAAEPENDHHNKIKRLSDIAFEVDPNPSQQIFHVYANDIIEGYDKSLSGYLLDDNFDKDTVLRLSKTLYKMSKERWKRIGATPKARYGQNNQ